MENFEGYLKQISQQTVKLMVDSVFKKHNVDRVRRTLTAAEREEMLTLVKNLETTANGLLEKFSKKD